MSHSPTPPAGGSCSSASGALSRIQVAVPKSKTAKLNVSVSLATFQSLLEAAVRSACLDAPFDTLCTKIDSLAAQIAKSQKKTLSYGQVAASKSVQDSKSSVPPSSASPTVPIREPHAPRYDFVLCQLDYKNPVLARESDTPADIQRTLNDILLRCDNEIQPKSPTPLLVRAVAKLHNGNIRIMWHNQDDRDTAQTAHDVWLPDLSPKLEVFYPSYCVIVHGVPTTFALNGETRQKEAASQGHRSGEHVSGK